MLRGTAHLLGAGDASLQEQGNEPERDECDGADVCFICSSHSCKINATPGEFLENTPEVGVAGSLAWMVMAGRCWGAGAGAGMPRQLEGETARPQAEAKRQRGSAVVPQRR